MESLPEEVHQIIYSFTTYKDLISLCRTSHRFKSIGNNPTLWKSLISDDIEKLYQECLLETNYFRGARMIELLQGADYPVNCWMGLFIATILQEMSTRNHDSELFSETLRSLARIFSSIARTDNTTQSSEAPDWKLAYTDRNYLSHTNFWYTHPNHIIDYAIFIALYSEN